MSYTGKWMGLEATVLSKVSQMQEDMHFIFCSYMNSRINNVDLKIVGTAGKWEDRRGGGRKAEEERVAGGADAANTQ